MDKNNFPRIETIFNKLICNTEDLLNLIGNPSGSGASTLISYFNQHAFNVFCNDEEYQERLLNKFIVYNDGVGVFLALFLLRKKISRIDATEFNKKLFERIMSDPKYKIGIIGGYDKMGKMTSHLQSERNILFYKNGIVDGTFYDTIMDAIHTCRPNIILIGMGIPFQEMLACKIADEYPNCTIICMGNFLEFYFKSAFRAPKVLRKIGLEWVHRLLQEPNRLWRRYLLGIPVFIYRFVLFIWWVKRK